jgi:ABC-2 type transport system ATP-binding protein
MTDAPTVVAARGVSHRYGERPALADVTFTVARGARYAFLGPNGSGKSTLFKLLATILPLQEGELSAFGVDLRRDPLALRARMGVVFQSPAVDKKLTVRQNLTYGGQMYGLAGDALRVRSDELLASTALAARAGDKVETLSGGLRRRVELAKCLLHRPELLVLDEPTTGLDPAARADLWSMLAGIEGLTVLFTTHLLDEAESADRVLILHQGRVVAEGIPGDLSRDAGGTSLEVSVEAGALAPAKELLAQRFGLQALVVEGTLRAQAPAVHTLVPAVVEALGARARRVSVSPPSLLDVFFHKTGGAAFDVTSPAPASTRRRRGGPGHHGGEG